VITMAHSRKCLFYCHFNSHHEVLTHNLGSKKGHPAWMPFKNLTCSIIQK